MANGYEMFLKSLEAYPIIICFCFPISGNAISIFLRFFSRSNCVGLFDALHTEIVCILK